MRKLASIQTIAEIKPIQDADRIEAYRVNGWWVVGQKDEFKVGDNVIYFEIDSWIPTELAPFLSKGQEPREYNGVKGERLRTAKLKGQISQGLLLPIYALPENEGDYDWSYIVDDDVTDLLNIQKWEPPMPAQMAGEARGLFPSYIPKTDQERVQNLPTVLEEYGDKAFEATIKIDGASSTIFFGGPSHDVHFGCCSRNYELKDTANNTIWEVARKLKLDTVLPTLDKFYAFQGEIFGEGLQSNPEKIKGNDFMVFDIYCITDGRYLTPDERVTLINTVNEKYGCGIKMVPVLETFVLNKKFSSIAEILDYAEGPSYNPSVKREGVVFKQMDGDFSFKAISNSYLMRHQDR